MKAIAIREPGGPEVLQPIEAETPSPGGYEVLIEVAVAGVNRPDCLQRAGLYPIPDGASPLPGLEVAGHIAEVGAQCSRFTVGDRVMALTHGGGYAEFCVADERHCLPIPKNMTLEAAAAFPETAFTVWSNLWMRGGLNSGERLLVHGGSSGIGTTAIQIAKALGVEVAVTAGTDEKCAFCLDIGADVAVNYRDGSWQDALATSWPEGVDVILDMVGARYFDANLDALRRGGRLSIIALLGGAVAEQASLAKILRNHLTVFGTTLRPQTNDQKAAIADGLTTCVLPLLESGEVKPVIFESLPLEAADQAHTLMESGKHMGKIVLTVREDLAKA